MINNSLSSLASAASIAAIEVGRPAVSGINNPGNSTLFLIGKTGRLSICSIISPPAENVEQAKVFSTFSLFLLSIRNHMRQQQTVAIFNRYDSLLQVQRKFDRPLEAVVCDLHRIMTPPL